MKERTSFKNARPSSMTIRFSIALAALLLFGSDVEALDRIRIAVSNPNIPNLTVSVAQKKGFFKDENLDAEIILMNPNVAITALDTGDIDYIASSAAPWWAALSRGCPGASRPGRW